MNNKFDKTFLKIILEEKFKNKKWKFVKKFEDVEIYFNSDHVTERLKSRYDKDKFVYYQLSIVYFLKILLRDKIFEKLGKRNLKGFTFHETTIDVWISGVLQNDKDEKQFRIYISTFLPSIKPKHNKYDYFIEFTLDEE